MFQLTRDNMIVLGIVLVLGATAALAVYMPQSRRLDDVRNDITTRKMEISSDKAKVAMVPKMVRQVEKMKVLYRDFDRRLPARQELGEFLREISNNLDESNLISESIKPGNPTREELFHTLPIIIKFKGSYGSLVSFLERLEKMERLTRVSKLDIVTDPKGKDLKIEMQMNIYFTENGTFPTAG